MGAQNKPSNPIKFHCERISKTNFEADHHGIKFKREFVKRHKHKIISKFAGK
jgi:hypothetical protein